MTELNAHDCITYLKNRLEENEHGHEYLVADLLEEIKCKTEECNKAKEEVKQLRTKVHGLEQAKTEKISDLELVRDKLIDMVEKAKAKETQIHDEGANTSSLPSDPNIRLPAGFTSVAPSRRPPQQASNGAGSSRSMVNSNPYRSNVNVHQEEVPRRNFTVRDLRKHNGISPASNGSIYIAMWGRVYDVSSRRDLYGPGGWCAMLAGHDVTRAHVRNKMNWVMEDYDDLNDMSATEMMRANMLEVSKYKKKYPCVGTLVNH